MLQNEEFVVLYKSEKDMANCLNNALIEAKKAYPNNLSVVTDPTSFDTTWTGMILQKHGFQRLEYTRDKQYRANYAMDAYFEDQETSIELTNELNHYPHHDALCILEKFIITRDKYKAKKKQNKKNCS